MARLGMALPNLPGVTPLIPEFARRIEAGGFAAVGAWTGSSTRIRIR